MSRERPPVLSRTASVNMAYAWVGQPRASRLNNAVRDLPEQREMPVDDPWSRPTLSDLHRILESIGRQDGANQREAERLELTVPAEITTSRGNTVSAMTREISRLGLGLLHRGAITPGEVTVRMASETRDFEYRVLIQWCHPCENGMFMSGGQFLRKSPDKEPRRD